MSEAVALGERCAREPVHDAPEEGAGHWLGLEEATVGPKERNRLPVFADGGVAARAVVHVLANDHRVRGVEVAAGIQ